MEIRLVAQKDNKARLELEGRIISVNAPTVLQQFKELAARYSVLTLDMEKLKYISSAGLRALLTLYKIMESKGGELILCNVGDEVREVLELTGLIDLMNIQD